jgi:hypothetical protein
LAYGARNWGCNMEDIVDSNNSFVECTFLKKILDEYNLEIVQIRLGGLCGLDLLGCCGTTNYGSHVVTGFEGGDQGAEPEVTIRAGDLNLR